MSLNYTDKLIFYKSLKRLSAFIPFYNAIQAGFPSPADDYMEEKLDLNRFLIKNPSSTFYIKVEGVSMIGAGIHPKDILIVDRSLKAKNNDIIIALVNGEFTVKRLSVQPLKVWLLPENPRYSPIDVTDTDFQVWGVVTYVIHNPKNQ
jgi:DNA polymerase V